MTRYEAAMVFARTLARLESLVADEVARTNAGLREDVTADVLADIEAAKAELVALIKDELANLDIPVQEKLLRKSLWSSQLKLPKLMTLFSNV